MLNLERCMASTAQRAADYYADAALVIFPDRTPHETPVVACVRGGIPAASQVSAADAGTVMGLSEALQGYPPVPSAWIDPSAAPDWLVPPGFGPVGSVAIASLPGQGLPSGALVLLRRPQSAAFTTMDEALAQEFAARAGAEMSAARLYTEQASVASALLQELRPPTLKRIAGVEYAGGYLPSSHHDSVGGDFYDVHPAAGDGDSCLVVLGDVCGKGLEAAVLAGRIRTAVHALLPLADDHLRVLRLLNTAVLDRERSRFATLVMASVRREADGVRLRLTGAGHPPPLILRAGGGIEEAPVHGTLVGAIPEVTAETVTVTLAPGESCFLYTDGVTEARGGPPGDAEFGDSRLHEVLAGCAGMPAEAVVERVQMLASQWVGDGRHDDMAVVVVSAPADRSLPYTADHGQAPDRSPA
ncbi:PP2C family protein-serine/threonine phosphatase [Streptomyces sp. NPDC097619]|uniref:PP2C family protein-serine/threonine phosphatase n=1 Tax=Streptomyces sp. NPDC097619 TaxID=3157228 RepID=UPI00331E4B6C